MDLLTYALQVLDQDRALRQRREEEVYKFQTDPALAERLVAHMQHRWLPEEKGKKIALGSPLAKIEAGIPGEDPRKNIGTATLRDFYADIAANPEGVRPAARLQNIYNQKLAEVAVPTYEAIRKDKAALLFKSGIADLPGSEEYIAKATAAGPGINFTNPALSFGIGAGSAVAAMPLEKFAAREGAGKLTRYLAKAFGHNIARAPHPIAKLVGIGLMAIPEFAAYDLLSGAVGQTEWRKTTSPLMKAVTELAVGAVSMKMAAAPMKKIIGKSAYLTKVFENASTKVAAAPTAANIIEMSKVGRELSDLKAKVASELQGTGIEEILSKSLQVPYSGRRILGSEALKDLSEDEIKALRNLVPGQVAMPTAEAGVVGQINKMIGEATPGITDEATRMFRSNVPGETMQDVIKRNIRNVYMRFGDDEALRKFEGITTDFVDKNIPDAEYGALRNIGIINPERVPSDIVKNIINIRETERAATRSLVDTNRLISANIDQVNAKLTAPVRKPVYTAVREETGSHIESFAQELPDIPDMPTTTSYLRDIGPAVVKDLIAGKNVQMASTVPTVTTTAAGAKITQSPIGKMTTSTVELPKEIADRLSTRSAVEAENISSGIRKALGRMSPAGTGRFADEIKQLKNADEARSFLEQKRETLSMKDYDQLENRVESWFRKNGMSLPVLAVGGFGLVTAASMLTPSEANAAGPDLAARKVAPYIVDRLAAGGRSTLDIIKEMVAKDMVPVTVAPGQKEVISRMRSFRVVPDIGQVTNIGRGEKKDWLLSIVSRLGTPGVFGELVYGANSKTGRALANPEVELTFRHQVVVPQNVNMLMDIYENTVRGVPGYMETKEEAGRAVRAAFSPIQKQYGPIIFERGWLAGQIGEIDSIIEKTTKRMGKAEADEVGGYKAFMEILNNRKAELKSMYDSHNAAMEGYNAARQSVLPALFQKYPSVRMALAMDGEMLDAITPLMSQEEKTAVGYLRKSHEKIAEWMVEVGERPIMDKPYIHYARHPDANYSSVQKKLESLFPNAMTGAPYAHFFHRSVGGKQMMPELDYVMREYLPDAMKRIETADFWAEGSDLGWRAHRNRVNQLGWKPAIEYWHAVDRAMQPAERSTMNKIFRVQYAMDAFRLLALSPSVALKHAVKLEANMANFGFGHTFSMYPETASKTLRYYSTELAKNVFGKHVEPDIVNEVMKAYTSHTRMTALIQDLNIYDPPQSWFERVMQKAGDKGALLVNFTERLDRAHSFVASMDMAAKKGMTAEQAAYGVIDTVLKTNFFSGMNNPAWLRNPKTRWLLMFQGTPFKIMEQRLLQMERTGISMTSAKEKLLQKVKQLRGDYNEARQEITFGMFKDALTSEKDIFGIPVAQQLARKMLILGTMLIGGEYLFNSDLLEHVAHIPGVRYEKGGLGLNINPLLNAAFGAGQRDEDDYWLSAFFQRWMPSGPIPALYTRMTRLSENDIPEQYRDSQLRYLFRIPVANKD